MGERVKKAWMRAAIVLITLVIMLGLGELLARFLSPSEYYYPRYEYSAEYGLIPGKNAVMVKGLPGKYELRYSVNAIRHRGELVTPGASGLPAVVVLGDSYTFGAGVGDGEEYAAVMRRRLEGRADVINLGIEGWGLTQEIRRYAEVGAAYDPIIVILQFCANDPDDNLTNPVTRVENGAFKFVNSTSPLNLQRKLLSQSFVQRSQLYNFFRSRATVYFHKRYVQRAQSRLKATGADSTRGANSAEDVYVELLELLAAQLHAEGRVLWMISVDGQLDRFPRISGVVREQEAQDHLRYIEVRDWLQGSAPYDSPEGHIWGTRAHAIIGEHLAREVSAALPDSAGIVRP